MKLSLYVFTVGLFLGVCFEALAVPRYTVLDLGPYGGASLLPTCLSRSGVIAGSCGTNRAFIRSASTGTTYIEPPQGYSTITITAVNDSGQAAGYFSTGYSDPRHPFVYTPGSGIRELAVPAVSYSDVCDINSSGTVAGSYSDADRVIHTYTVTESGVVNDVAVGSGQIIDLSLDDSGRLLSSYYTDATDPWGWPVFEPEAFLCSGDQVQDANSLVHLTTDEPYIIHKVVHANDINNSGQIVGLIGSYEAEFGDPGIPKYIVGVDPICYYAPLYGFIYTPGDPLVTFLPLYDLAVNDLGQAVGTCSYYDDAMGGFSAAYLYCDGIALDLNGLIDGLNQPWNLVAARDINNNGQIIVAANMWDGQWHDATFLLTAVPEPSSLLMLIPGAALAAGAALRGFRRR